MADHESIDLWRETLTILERDLNRTSFKTWLSSTKLIAHNNSQVIIGVPNEFAKNWLETRFYNLVKNTMELIANQILTIYFVLPGDNYAALLQDIQLNKNEEESLSFVSTKLNPKYTFDSFVVGDSNRFTHAASLAVADSLSEAYNPLFIYGGVGLGKTHLMHAIGHYVQAKLPNKSVLYVSTEKFTNELINAIRDDKMANFRARYRNIDLLLVDDIQFLAGKEKTQEEFFHTFNSLHEANKQLVITSDRPPRDIPTLERRLRSRFEWGLITDIQPPDLETRMAILRKKARIENIDLPNDVSLMIAKQITTNIRQLEGALIRLSAYTSINNLPINLKTATMALEDILPEVTNPITIELIQKKVADFYNLTIADFKAQKRQHHISLPRQIAMYLCRELTDSSLPKIGNDFGGRDHTTVIHACGKINQLLGIDSNLKNQIEELIDEIKQTKC